MAMRLNNASPSLLSAGSPIPENLIPNVLQKLIKCPIERIERFVVVSLLIGFRGLHHSTASVQHIGHKVIQLQPGFLNV